MKLKKLLAVALAICLTLSVTACSKKDFTAVTLGAVVLELGESKTIEPVLSAESGEGEDAVEVTVTMAENTATGLEASFVEGALTLKGVTPGSYTLTFTQTAKGYNDGTLTMPITVNELPPPPLEAAFFSEQLGINNSLPPKSDISVSVEQGLGSSVSVMTKVEGFALTATSSDPCVEVTVEGSELHLNPVSPGTAVITITASHPQYSDAVGECSIEVRPPHVSLALSQDTADVTVGQSTTIPIKYDGELSFSVAPDIATATVDDSGKVTVTGVKEGNCTVEITASKEGFTDSVASLALTVTAAAPPAPKLPASPEAKYTELEAEILKYINIERAAMGAPALTMNSTMSKAARLRAKETSENQSHTRPDGRRGLTVFGDFGITKYNITGENLSGSDGAENGSEIVQRWMDSPSHMSALLDERFTVTGVGAYLDESGTYRYCQLFGGVVVT